MFPTIKDVETFQLEFGAESTLQRFQIPREGYHGTQSCIVIRPANTKEETLILAWKLMREQALWILMHAQDLPASERYMIIVGWSQSVRRLQGQIFKAGGTIADVQIISNSADWSEFCNATREQALHRRWEKEVFDSRDASVS